MRRAASAFATALALGAGTPGCGTVEGVARTNSPENACPDHPCDAYGELVPGRGRATCNAGRCEHSAANLTYAYRVVVHVPTSSEEVAGLTFQLTSEQLRTPDLRSRCSPPTCVRLQSFEAAGRYTFTAAAARAAGMPLEDTSVSVPVRVSFVPLVGTREASDLGLPLDTTFFSSSFRSASPDAPEEIVYSGPVSPGAYVRTYFPQPPFDAFLPPVSDALPTVGARILAETGNVQLGDARHPLDDPEGTSRVALVRRAEGLDGWRIWLADSVNQQRISTLRRLEGIESEVLLATSGQAAGEAAALREGVDVVLSPPDDWIAVPRLVSTLIGGAGLRPLNYPSLPRPTRVTGLVAARPEDDPAATPRAVPSRVSLRSTRLMQASGDLSQLLRYETTVTTDASGLFATVVPPGEYAVTVEPEPLTGRGKTTIPVLVEGEAYALNIDSAPLATVTTGRALLSDGRPLADADVLATPSTSPSVPRRLRPRPARTRTDREGRFSLGLDQGAYHLTVIPQEGSGFPRVVVLTAIGGKEAILPDVEVPAPVKLAFTLNNASAFLPIPHAVVRVFATLPDGGAVEVGRSVSDAEGRVEILLAREPR